MIAAPCPRYLETFLSCPARPTPRPAGERRWAPVRPMLRHGQARPGPADLVRRILVYRPNTMACACSSRSSGPPDTRLTLRSRSAVARPRNSRTFVASWSASPGGCGRPSCSMASWCDRCARQTPRSSGSPAHPPRRRNARSSVSGGAARGLRRIEHPGDAGPTCAGCRSSTARPAWSAVFGTLRRGGVRMAEMAAGDGRRSTERAAQDGWEGLVAKTRIRPTRAGGGARPGSS